MAPLYTVERTYAHDVDVLWRAWTDAAALQQWYAPVDLTVVPDSVVSDAVVGGWWTVGVDVPSHGFVAWFFGRYTDVEPGRRFEHTLHYTQDEGEFRQRDVTTEHHLVAVDFEPSDDGTLVRWQQFGEMPAEQVDATRAGMESYFDSLERYLSR